MVNRLYLLLFATVCVSELDLFPQVTAAQSKRKSQTVCDDYAVNLPPYTSLLIPGGQTSEIGEFPHVAALGYYDAAKKEYKFRCVGSLISDSYVVTVAHCVVTVLPEEVKIVRLGSTDVPETIKTPDPKLDHDVVSITVHTNYSRRTRDNDIALVKIKKLNFTGKVQPACLRTKSDVPPKMTVAGWGGGYEGRSDILQKADVTLMSLEECNKVFADKISGNVGESQVCALHKKRDDPCRTRSGSPLQFHTDMNMWELVGITAYGMGCRVDTPTVYTKVYHHLDWIEKIVWPSP